jgi:hypothetical protein
MKGAHDFSSAAVRIARERNVEERRQEAERELEAGDGAPASSTTSTKQAPERHTDATRTTSAPVWRGISSE